MSVLESIAGGLGAVARTFDQLVPDFGDLAEEICDAVLPEVVGDVVSLGLNIVGGNYAAAVADGLDLLENVARGSADDATDMALDPGPPSPEVIYEAPDAPRFPGPGSSPVPPGQDADAPVLARAAGPAIDDSFWGQSDDQLLQAIRQGRIPQDVVESREGMLRLQQRMNDIQQMNALMTNMLRAMHEMEMEVIRHVRA